MGVVSVGGVCFSAFFGVVFFAGAALALALFVALEAAVFLVVFVLDIVRLLNLKGDGLAAIIRRRVPPDATRSSRVSAYSA